MAPGVPLSREEILELQRQQLQKELDYLGDCHAATMEYEGRLKRTSLTTKQRFLGIGLRSPVISWGVLLQ